jgi:hypothetical protein
MRWFGDEMGNEDDYTFQLRPMVDFGRVQWALMGYRQFNLAIGIENNSGGWGGITLASHFLDGPVTIV